MTPLFKIILAVAMATPMTFAAIVSPAHRISASSGGHSFNPTFSADGHHLVFVSHANNLVTNDDLGLWLDVFVHDLVTSNTVLVSVSTNGFGGANADATYPSISSNGQFIAFASRASNLAPGNTNESSQVFLRDMTTGVIRLLSLDTNGAVPLASSGNPLISADGRYVIFESAAPNLTANTFTPGLNIYRRDTWSNTTTLASITVGQFAPGCELGSITPDARFIAHRAATNNFSTVDAFVRDMNSGVDTQISTNVSAIIASGDAYRCSLPVLSADGRFAAFLVTPFYAAGQFAVRHDLQTGTTLVLSTNATNVSHGIQMTGDGRFVLFEEMDSMPPFSKVQLWDAQLGTTTNIACIVPDMARNASMSADGSRLAFIGCSNVYARDLATGNTLLVSANTNDAPSNGSFTFVEPVISPDGTRVAFDAAATDLVPGDFNECYDVFLRDVLLGTTELISKASPAKPATTSTAHSFLGPNSVSADGRIVVSTRYDDPAFFRDTNRMADVYVHDTLTGQSHALSIDTNLYQSELGGPPFYLENTNSYFSPIVSADGSTVAAVRKAFTSVFGSPRSDIVWAWGTNGVFGSGMSVANRSDIGNGIGNGSSFDPSLSADGQSLVFTTTSSDLIAGDPNTRADIILRRRFLGTNGMWSASNYLVSATPSGVVGNGASSNGVISADGRWVVFNSMAQDLVAPAPGGNWNLFARDLLSNTTHRIAGPLSYPLSQFQISRSSRYVVMCWNFDVVLHDLLLKTNVFSFYADANVSQRSPSVSDDGQLIAYAISSTRIHVKDLLANPPELVAQWNGGLRDPIISPDGRHVVFRGEANVTGLVPLDDNRSSDVFVRDRLLGVTFAVSVNLQGKVSNSSATRSVLAADGRTVVFQSAASDLAAGDYNDKRDIFILKLGSPDTDGDGLDDDWEVTYFNNLSRNGSGDFDSDGLSDLQEFLAGTDPTNSNSFFRVLTVSPAGGGSMVLLWSGNPSRSYRAEFKDNLNAANWTALTGTISWNGSTASIADSSAGAATNRYYRVARLP